MLILKSRKPGPLQVLSSLSPTATRIAAARKQVFTCCASKIIASSSRSTISSSGYYYGSSIQQSFPYSTSTITNKNNVHPHFLISKAFPTHIIFGANTDVGKTVVSTCLVKNNILLGTGGGSGGGQQEQEQQYQYPSGVHYIKPLQCGGSDEHFVRRHLPQQPQLHQQQQQQQQYGQHSSSSSSNKNHENFVVGLHTLFQWDTPASPHLASRLENKPVSDEAVLSALGDKLSWITTTCATTATATAAANDEETHVQSSSTTSGINRIWIETAGGVLSPSASSPRNNSPRHAASLLSENKTSWGWSTQADLYSSLHLPAVLVGDGRLGGISATLSALESLIVRGYDVHAIVLIDSTTTPTYQDHDHGAIIIKEEHSNVHALQEYARRKLKLRSGSGRPLLQHPDSIVALPPLPPIDVPLDEYLESCLVQEKVQCLDSYLTQQWNDHVDMLWELGGEEGSQQLWWPFTQHQGYHDHEKNMKQKRPTVIDGAKGDYFSILEDKDGARESDGSRKELVRKLHFDACASWWTQGMGHGETTLSLAAAAAAGKFGHVIFPDVVHEPAKALADRLIHSKSGPGRGWASRVFFTDDGSTAMEVAIKMGMKKFLHDLELKGTKLDETVTKLTVCAQRDCYHGDTLGVMDVAEPSVFNKGQHPWYEPKGLFLDYPTMSYMDGSIGISPPSCCPASDNPIMFENIGEILDIRKRLSSDNLYDHYTKVIKQEWDTYESESDRLIGSVIIEPILLGAGGMKFIDPLWQRALMDVSCTRSVPVIFDEVASGMYRLGVSSCREILGANPDIAAYAKLLTGGLVPMSVTLATEDVFRTFLGDSKAEALLHGHSYTAHTVGCVSSIHALDTYAELLENHHDSSNKVETTSQVIPKFVVDAYFDQQEVAALSNLPFVQQSMSLGTVLAITLEPDEKGSGYAANGKSVPVVQNLLKNGVYARPLGNVVYIMVSPLTKKEECSRLCNLLKDSVLTL